MKTNQPIQIRHKERMQEMSKYLPRSLKYMIPYLEKKRLRELKISKKTIFDIFSFTKWMVTTPKIDSAWFEVVEQFIKAFGLCMVNSFTKGYGRVIRKPEKIEEVKKQIWHLIGLVETMLKKIDSHCKLRDFHFTALETLKVQSRFQYNVFKKVERIEVQLDDEHEFFYTFIYNSRRWAGDCFAKLRTGAEFDSDYFKEQQTELAELRQSQELVEQHLLKRLNDLDKKFYAKYINFYLRIKFELESKLLQASTPQDSLNKEQIVLQNLKHVHDNHGRHVRQINRPQNWPQDFRQDSQIIFQRGEIQQSSFGSAVVTQNNNDSDDSQTQSSIEEKYLQLQQGEISPQNNLLYSLKNQSINKDQTYTHQSLRSQSDYQQKILHQTFIFEEKYEKGAKKQIPKPKVAQHQIISDQKKSQNKYFVTTKTNEQKILDSIREKINKLRQLKIDKMGFKPYQKTQESVKLQQDKKIVETAKILVGQRKRKPTQYMPLINFRQKKEEK